MARDAPTLIALQEERPVGFATVQIAGASAHLAAIAVLERARGMGFGAALVRAAEKLARGKRCRELSLTTADSNLAALDLFLKHGYRRERLRAGRYARGQRTIELKKQL
jgi:ribosomal protein S18 acetylase RimI-like enzyme